MSNLDYFICRLIAQKLNRYLNSLFYECSYAFQENKGIQTAVEKCRIYLEGGCNYVVNIDISSFFDNIQHERMMNLLEELIEDEAVLKLIEVFIKCNVEYDKSRIEYKNIGLVQGNPVSPVLSNLYLNDLDKYMEERGYCWVRYSDDINVYCDEAEEAYEILADIKTFLMTIGLNVNEDKTGVYNPYNRIFLGYDFYKNNDRIEIKKHIYKKQKTYSYWHDSAIEKVNHEYHLINNGVLNKKDYSLLFESEKEKYNIPVEVVQQINIYDNVTISYQALKYISDKGIKIAFVNWNEMPMGYYVPQNAIKSNRTMIKQFEKYIDEKERLHIAKKLEIACFHNIRANLRYYDKKNNNLKEEIEEVTQYIVQANEAKSIDELMLIEGRCRQKYYHSFNKIINDSNFEFIHRTKRPPKDQINTLISFLNTLLYNQVLFTIYKTSLDPRVGIIHATNRRNFTLNLDIADLLKPVIVDRVIFTLINTRQIKADVHFEKVGNDGLYLNKEGKRIVISRFEDKLNSTITIKERIITYRQLIEDEVYKYQRYVNDESSKYNPYKYY